VRAQPRIVPPLRLNAGDAVSVETLERFHAAGCRVVDISVDDASALQDGRLSACQRGSGGAEPPDNSTLSAGQYAAAHGWTMLLHIGALRETSSRLRTVAGPAGGFAGMRAPVDPAVIARFLDALEREGALPRTILLTLNPEAHAQLAVFSGSFTKEGSPGHVQLGPAWWWCDHAHGVRDVLEKTAAYGVLSTFIGMTTDSRSILSLARHDWFRRTLCKWVAGKVAAGDFPDDPALLRPLVESICYNNAKRIFAS
jgi:glucuronate isomerase